jgi:hypothetical protein
VFDDAHAGEQYVSKAYTIEVSRQAHGAIWSEALEAVAPMLPEERYHQLIGNAPGAGTRELVDGLVLALRDDVLPALARRSRPSQASPVARSLPMMPSVDT